MIKIKFLILKHAFVPIIVLLYNLHLSNLILAFNFKSKYILILTKKEIQYSNSVYFNYYLLFYLLKKNLNYIVCLNVIDNLFDFNLLTVKYCGCFLRIKKNLIHLKVIFLEENEYFKRRRKFN